MGVMESPDRIRRHDVVASDAELLKREFVTRDPEGLPNLSMTLPINFQTAIIEFLYDLTPPKGIERDYIWCAHDGKQTHWRGFVMKTDDGTRFLIGKDCGLEIFGIDFKSEARRFNFDRRRQRYLFQLESVHQTLPSAISELTALLKSPTIGQFESIRVRLRYKMPDLNKCLLLAVTRHSGSLVVQEKARDYAAELRRAERYGDDDEELERAREAKDRGEITVTAYKKLREEIRDQKKFREQGPIYTTISKSLGNVLGADLFLPATAPKNALELCLDKMLSIQTQLGEASEKISTQKLQLAFRKLRECLQGIDDELSKLHAPLRFFSATELERIAEWASQSEECNGRYRREGATIIHASERGDVVVSLPTNYDVPKMPALDTLKLALTHSSDETNL